MINPRLIPPHWKFYSDQEKVAYISAFSFVLDKMCTGGNGVILSDMLETLKEDIGINV